MSARTVLHQVGIGVAVRGWTQITALIVILFAGRILEREQFGVYAMASVFIVLLSTMIYSGVYEYIIKTANLDDIADTCFWMTLAVATGGTILMVALSPGVAALSHAPEVGKLMLLLAPSAIIAAINSWQEALLLRANRIAANYAIWFASETLASAFSVLLLLHGGGLMSLIGYRYGQVVLLLVGYATQRPRLPRLRWSRQVAREAMAFASNLYVSRFVGILSNYGADLIIGFLVGPAATALYRLASRMVFGISEICYQPIRTIAWVRFTRSIRDHRKPDEEWLSLMQLLSLVIWPALAGAASLAKPLVVTLLGAKWAPAVPIVVILTGARAAGLFEIFLDPILGSINQPRRLLRIRVAVTSVAIASLFVLGHFGVVAAAWSQVLSLTIIAIVTITIGMDVTSLTLATLIRSLAPGAFTAACTCIAARLGAHWATAWHPGLSVALAGGVVAGGLVWASLFGLVFRGTTMAAIHRFREPATMVASAP